MCLFEIVKFFKSANENNPFGRCDVSGFGYTQPCHVWQADGRVVRNVSVKIQELSHKSTEKGGLVIAGWTR